MQPGLYPFAIVNDLFDEDLDPDLYLEADNEAFAGWAAPEAAEPDPAASLPGPARPS